MKKQGSIFWKAFAAVVSGVCAIVFAVKLVDYMKVGNNVSEMSMLVWLGVFVCSLLAVGLISLLTEIRDGIYGFNPNTKPADKDDCDNTYRVNEYGSMKDKRCE